MKICLATMLVLYASTASAQTVSLSSTLDFPATSTITVSGSGALVVEEDLTLRKDISGSGKIIMRGNKQQTIYGNNFAVPTLEINNVNGVSLPDFSGNLTVRNGLVFTNGILQLNYDDLILQRGATITGHSSTRYIKTLGIGNLVYRFSGTFATLLLPIGNSKYRPVNFSIAALSAAIGTLSIRSVDSTSSNMPNHMQNYLTNYWPYTISGVNAGTPLFTAQYDPADVNGTEAKLTGYNFDGTDWSSASSAIDVANNKLTVNGIFGAGEIFGMNKFIAVGARAFLQGAYNNTTGLMSDALRTPSNIIPLSDPYRTSPYASNFTHVNNADAEVADASVFANQTSTNDNIADWVFLELRNLNASPGNTVLQTRSALIQRDGDIVDVDGVSPVTFNNVNVGNYAITVRHRNHLGLSLDPVAAPRNFTERKSSAFSAANVADLRTSTNAQVFGTETAFNTSTHPTLGTVKMLWAGNVSSDRTVKYSGPGNDNSYLLTTLLNGNSTTVLNNVYSPGDINFDRMLRYSGPGNDNSYLLTTVLNGSSVTIVNQQIPN